MKLSVKWLAGLAVLVLAIVAVVGATSTTKADEGVIYVKNTGQFTTTEPGKNLDDDDEETVSTLWATYAADIGAGEALRLINSDTDAMAGTAGDSEDADLIKIMIVDAGYDIATEITDDVGTGLDLSAFFATTVIAVTDFPSSPVASAPDKVKIFLDDGAGGADGDIDGDETQIAGPDDDDTTTFIKRATVTAVTAGGDAISVRSEVSGFGAAVDVIVVYDTSAENTLVNGVNPDPTDGIDPLGVTPDDPKVVAKSGGGNTVGLFLEETERSSGRFEGYLRLTDGNGDDPGDPDDWGLTTGAATDATPAGAAVLGVRTSTITIEYVDSDGDTRRTTIRIDTSAPRPVVTSPTHELATQNQQPTFTGTVNDVGAGLVIDETNLYIDETEDSAGPGGNDDPVLDSTGDPAGVGVEQDIDKDGANDGDLTFSFSHNPENLLDDLTDSPDHIVDFQIRAQDRAGNWGFSDADDDPTQDDDPVGQGVTIDPTLDADGEFINGAFDAHFITIDRVAPNLLDDDDVGFIAGVHETGVGLEGDDEVDDDNSLRITFSDEVQNVSPSDFSVEFPSLRATLVPTGAMVDDEKVYLTLAEKIPADERPIVRIQGSVADKAGNSTQFGDVIVADGIEPTLEFTISGGSGNGEESDEGPDMLTDDKITVTITSNEPLNGAPKVDVHVDKAAAKDDDESGTAITATTAGENTWVFNFNSDSGTGDRSLVITGTDLADSDDNPNIAPNVGTVGEFDDVVFRVDGEVPVPVITPSDQVGIESVTNQRRPFIVIDYGKAGEEATITISEILLDDVDVTDNLVRSQSGVRFFLLPTSDLSIGEHDVLIPAESAVDAAGNESGTVEITFEVEERDSFERSIFAGWNAISFPSDPIDPDINSVFGHSGHDAVLGFDPGVPGGWTVAVRDEVSGDLEPATENGLTSVRSTQAYWVHALDFEPVEVDLIGETLPGAGSPPGIVSIDTVVGFNAIPIVDTSRKQTTDDAGETLVRREPDLGTPDPDDTKAVDVLVEDYLGSLEFGRVYKWDPAGLRFVRQTSVTPVTIGDVLFVEVPESATPIFP